MNTSKASVTLRQFRDNLSELLISCERPVVVTKDGIPLGFFLPATIWRAQQDSEAASHLVELALAHSGHTREAVQTSIDGAGLKKRHLSRAVLGANRAHVVGQERGVQKR
jgi:antitoxin (DNA-binding transcriptional repressor) of toxin-antitoxin stability system